VLEDPLETGPLDGRGLYGISVTSELTGVPPQNLRSYEAKGLLEPARTAGGTRRYSDRDIARIERITVLLEAGLNLRGIGQVLELEAETQRLRQEIARLRSAAAEKRVRTPRER
jgi:MerR family transcriptional regulator, heat shock protein HspR